MTLTATERLLACFSWCLSLGFLTFTLGNLLITACWIIDLKFQPLDMIPTFWTVGLEEEDEGGGGVRCYSICLHTLTLRMMRPHTYIYSFQTIKAASQKWDPYKTCIFEKTQRESLYFFWWRCTPGDTGHCCFCLPYACNNKTPCVPWATYCSFSSTLLWLRSDVSADMFIVRAVSGPSIHSALCSSCLLDRVMLRLHLKTCWSKDCNCQGWILAELGGVTFFSINTASINGQVLRHKRRHKVKLEGWGGGGWQRWRRRVTSSLNKTNEVNMCHVL